MQEPLCAVLLIVPTIGIALGTRTLTRRLNIGGGASGILYGAVIGVYLVALGEFAFSRGMSCLLAGGLFQIHAAFFGIFLAFLSGVTSSHFQPETPAWRWVTTVGLPAFWLLVYGSLGGFIAWAWRLSTRAPTTSTEPVAPPPKA